MFPFLICSRIVARAFGKIRNPPAAAQAKQDEPAFWRAPDDLARGGETVRRRNQRLRWPPLRWPAPMLALAITRGLLAWLARAV